MIWYVIKLKKKLSVAFFIVLCIISKPQKTKWIALAQWYPDESGQSSTSDIDHSKLYL